MEHFERKRIRLRDYDYSQNGAYFITICTKNREPLLSQIVGSDDPVRPNIINLSPIGNIVSDCWTSINEIYSNVQANKFIIMPNHFHGIIIIDSDTSERSPVDGQSRPSLQKIVQGFKSVTTRRCFPLGFTTIWQHSFYDHIIRSEQEYLDIWEYIESNPYKWLDDEYYSVL